MKNSLKKDALSVCGGLYRMNATTAIGYLFNPTMDEKEVNIGMFCHHTNEIDKYQWTYFYSFETKKFKTIR